MQGQEYLYFLQDQDQRFASFDDVMGLTWQLQPTPLHFSPDGWQDMGLFVERNRKYFSLDVTYGIPQNFVEDAAGILKTIFYLRGIMGVCNLTILEEKIFFSPTQYGYYYDLLVKAEIDFSTFVHSGPTATASILDSELTRLIKANETTVYEIPLEPLGVKVFMDGLKLKQYANYIVSEPFDPNFNSTGNHVLGMTVSSVEATTQIGSISSVRLEGDRDVDLAAHLDSAVLASGNADDTPLFNWDFGVKISYTHQYFDSATNRFRQLPPPNVNYSLWLNVIPNGSTVGTRIKLQTFLMVLDQADIIDSVRNNYHAHFQLKGSLTVPIPENSHVFLMGGIFEDTNENTQGLPDTVPIPLRFNFNYDTVTSLKSNTDPNFWINYFTKFPSGMIQALDAWVLFSKIVDKLTAGKFLAESTLLKGLQTLPANRFAYKMYPKTIYTSGDALRRITGAVIKTSLADFFQGMNATFGGVGMGIVDGKLRIEPKKYWVKVADADVITLGEVSNLKISPATDYLFSAIDVGCPNETYGSSDSTDINGRYEFNTTQHYTSPQNRVVSTLDLTTKYRRDMFGIEFTRINLEGKTTTDASTDNDVFEIHVGDKKGGGLTPINLPGGGVINVDFGLPFYLLDRTANAYTTGLLDRDSAFNVMLSPKHCIFRAGDYIRSCLDRLEAEKIVFASADKNLSMSTIYPNGAAVIERDDITVGSLDMPIFKPVILEVLSPMPDGYLTAGPVKKMNCTVGNGTIPLSGFPIKSGIQPASEKPQVTQLLCSHDVDLTPLINYFG